MSKKVAQGKVKTLDLEDQPAVVESFQLLCFEEEVNKCCGSEFWR
jgi:hypothetical protein